jgi:glycopeptide antibiotics resistance protein
MQSIQAGHAWIGLAVALPVLLLCLGRVRHLSAGHLLAVAAFVSYLVVVATFTILPFRLDDEYLSRPPFDPAIVLEPFFLGRPEAVMSPSQYLGNVLLGIPFGFLVPFVWRVSLSRVLIAGLCFSLLIEALQWLTTKLMIAFPTRAADINDVILNTLGVLIGVAAFAVVRFGYRMVFSRTASAPRAWAHFHARLTG